jgi:methionine salvage enolase-phosphatase E1
VLLPLNVDNGLVRHCSRTLTYLNNSNADQVKAAVQQSIEWQMREDRKIGALKSFQGFMWKKGYDSGELLGQ